jgi:hypothetical protein
MRYTVGILALAAVLGVTGAGAQQLAQPPTEGIVFQCPREQLPALRRQMSAYLAGLGIAPRLYAAQTSTPPDAASTLLGTLSFTLTTPAQDTNTLNLHARPEMGITWAKVSLIDAHQRRHVVRTVSAKEIVLAMMQHGRQTRFEGAACGAPAARQSMQALKDQVGLRQTIVAWAEQLHWGWPDGGPAEWNEDYWIKGTPRPGRTLDAAMLDAFTHQAKYEIGCYTATKLALVQGVMDYYRRIKRDAASSALIHQRLWTDGDPLVNIEPDDMWSFESDYDHDAQPAPGKLIKLQRRVAPRNFIPGDWVYFVNTDPNTQSKTGYEGSNALYLGRNRFDDYYDDHAHAYTFEEKLDEVYQWRNGVFSRSRDAARIEKLSSARTLRLSLPPRQGGLVLRLRAVPYQFGYEDLPPVMKPAATPKP